MHQSTRTLVIYTLLLTLFAGVSLLSWNLLLPERNTLMLVEQSVTNLCKSEDTQDSKEEKTVFEEANKQEYNESSRIINVEVRLPMHDVEDSEFYFMVVQVPKSASPYQFKVIAEKDMLEVSPAISPTSVLLSSSSKPENQQPIVNAGSPTPTSVQNPKKKSPFRKQTPQPTNTQTQTEHITSSGKYIHHVMTYNTGFESSTRRIKIALALPVSSGNRQRRKFESLDHSPLWTVLFPSFLNCTMLNETKNQFEYGLFIGYDEGDGVFDQPNAAEELIHRFSSMMAALWPTENLASFTISLEVCKMANMQSAPSWIVSELLNKAYQQGFHYFFQINDDTEFLDPYWENALVSRLTTNPFLSNFGVTGPEDTYNRRLVTHAFVHRTHMEIFGRMFDEYFKNWWSDDWISSVYGKANLLRDSGVRVYHHATMPRYQIHMEAREEIEKRVADGKEKILKWLTKHHPEKANTWWTSWRVAIGAFPGFIGEKNVTKKPEQ